MCLLLRQGFQCRSGIPPPIISQNTPGLTDERQTAIGIDFWGYRISLWRHNVTSLTKKASQMFCGPLKESAERCAVAGLAKLVRMGNKRCHFFEFSLVLQDSVILLNFVSLVIPGNYRVRVVSRSGRTKPITKRGNEHCDWFTLPLLLPTPTIWFSLDRKRWNR